MNIYIIFSILGFCFASLLLLPICLAKDISKRQKSIFATVVLVVFLGGSMVLYHHFGTPEIIPLLAEREEKLVVLKEKITANSNEIKQNPKNLKAWVELGDAFMETQQFAAAENAFKQAVLLSSGNPVLIMAYARSIIAKEDGKVSDEALKSLNMLLILDPNNEEVRYFMAVRKLQTGDTQNAMKEMKALYKSLPDDSPVKSMINRQIGREAKP